MADTDLSKWTVTQLRDECEQRGMDTTGRKQDLIDRLMQVEFSDAKEDYKSGEVAPKEHKTEDMGQGQTDATMYAIQNMMTMMSQMMKNSMEERNLWKEQLQQERDHQDKVRREMIEEDRRTRANERKDEIEAKKRPKDPPIQRLRDEDDIENLLTVFERTAMLCKWPREYWTIKLGTSLTGRAQEAYASVHQEDAGNYDIVKEAILKRYSINEETYRKRFRGLHRNTEENINAFNIRLHDIFNKWMKEVTTVEQMKDRVIKEQLISVLPTEVQTWVREHNPKDTNEVVDLADNYIEAHHTTDDSHYWKNHPTVKKMPYTQSFPPMYSKPLISEAQKNLGNKCYKCLEEGHYAKDCTNEAKCFKCFKPGHKAEDCSKSCFNCGELGHRAEHCTQIHRSLLKCEICQNNHATSDCRTDMSKKCSKCGKYGHVTEKCYIRAFLCRTTGDTNKEYASRYDETIPGRINSKETDFLVDTCSFTTIVHPDVVDPSIVDYHKPVNMTCIHGDSKLYPTAPIKIEINNQTYDVQAAVSKELPTPVLIGQDILKKLDTNKMKNNEQREKQNAIEQYERHLRQLQQKQLAQEEKNKAITEKESLLDKMKTVIDNTSEVTSLQETNQQLQNENTRLMERMTELDQMQSLQQQINKTMSEMMEQKNKLAYDKSRQESRLDQLQLEMHTLTGAIEQINKVMDK